VEAQKSFNSQWNPEPKTAMLEVITICYFKLYYIVNKKKTHSNKNSMVLAQKTDMKKRP
jgi:hypothetical protein